MTEVVAREEWIGFCAEFSRQHSGWRADLRVEAPAGGPDRQLARGVPFYGLTAHPHDGQVSLSLLMGSEESLFTHDIPDPRSLELHTAPGGAHQGLTVTARSGMRTTLRFSVPAAPEQLDGIAGVER